MNPQTFKGFNAKATLYDDRIEIRWDLLARIGGAKGSVVALTDLVQPVSKPPTAWVNGYVYLATDADPAHLSYWADPPKWKIGGQRQLIVFNWFQRSIQAAFLAALETAWRAVRTES